MRRRRVRQHEVRSLRVKPGSAPIEIMSRSYKKPYYTDQQTWAKRDANRSVRRAKNVSNGNAYKKEYCSYNIRDWSFHCPKDKKAYRK